MKPDFILGCSSIIMILFLATVPVMAAEFSVVNDPSGWDVSDIIAVFTTALAVILGVVSFIGYRRDQRSKFLLVTLAFAIFALKGVFILSGDLLALQQSLFDVIASLLDFLVLICIFLSISMK